MNYSDEEALLNLIKELKAISNVHVRETLTMDTALRLLAEREINLVNCRQEFVDILADMIKG